MDLETLISRVGTITFPDYDTIHEIICLPDGSVEKDPLSGKGKEGDLAKKSASGRINFLDSFLFCFFTRFNTNIKLERYHVEYMNFKNIFLDELRSGVMRNWRISTNKRDKGVVLANIEKKKLDKYTLQWIADYHDITVLIDEREYVPRKTKQNKPVLKLLHSDDGYKLN